MSFGFAIGDFIAVSKLANDVRKRLVDSPGHFTALAHETKCFSNVVQDLDDLAPHRTLNPSEKQQLKDLAKSCQAVLESINKTLDRYHVLGSASHNARTAAKKFWKRLTFEPDDVKELRQRLISVTSLLNHFYSQLHRSAHA